MNAQRNINRVSLRACLALVFFAACGAQRVAGQSIVEGYYPGDLTMWDRIFRESPPLYSGDLMPVGAIAPHHDLELLTLNRFYASFGKAFRPPVVAVISPNHFERGDGDVLVPKRARFRDQYGVTIPDSTFIDALVKTGAARKDDRLWKGEHGVFAHVAFVRRYFPDAVFLPIVIKPDATPETADRLATALNEILPPGSLVIGSVDFSHYQIHSVSERHDEVTRATIQNFEIDLIPSLEIDSPQTVQAVMRFCALRGNKNARMLMKNSSWDYVKNDEGETTSHQYWFFLPGEPTPRRSFTMFIGGTVRKPLGLGLRRSWQWDRYGKAREAGVRCLSRLAGKEARFLMGFDAYLFDMPVGSAEFECHGVKVRCVTIDASSVTKRAFPIPDQSLINIAILNGECANPEDTLNDLIRLGYTAIVWHGEATSLLATVDPTDSRARITDLGVLYDPGHEMKGSVAFVSIVEGVCDLMTLPYSSSDGLPPAIHQFVEIQ